MSFFRSLHMYYITCIILSSWYFESGYFYHSFYCFIANARPLFDEIIFPVHALGQMYACLLVDMRNRSTFRIIEYFLTQNLVNTEH